MEGARGGRDGTRREGRTSMGSDKLCSPAGSCCRTRTWIVASAPAGCVGAGTAALAIATTYCLSLGGSDVTSVPACPPSPFAFAFDLFDRVAPTSTNRVRSTRRRSCAARVPSRADECAPRGVRALTKRSRAGEKSKKPKTRKISIVASKRWGFTKMGPEILAGVWGHLTNSFRRCSQYKLPISIQATYGFLVMHDHIFL